MVDPERSAPSSKPPRAAKTSPLGRRLVASAKEMLAHRRGTIELPSYTTNEPEAVKRALSR
ncbi:MAG: hypothetical protein IT565_01360 [Rhodospirillales bacterium]|nr:hypothetical protein [Rhodospirillales bacterium]